MSVMDWLAETKRTYIGNPNSVRDFRTQMRGKKGPAFLAAYLSILVILSLTFYSGVAGQTSLSVTEAQSRLEMFYNQILGLLELMVLVVAPALSGSLMVSEYHRKSMDLLLSSPMTSRELFIGKLMSSWRYIWMLLALALPVVSVCVVMGGATWGQVLASFLLLSLHGLLAAAIALPIAVLSGKVINTVLLSYAAIAGLQLLIGVPISLFGSMGALGMGMGRQELSPFVSLIPWMTGLAASSSYTVFGVAIPLWLWGIALHLIAVRILVLGASSAISRHGSPETRNLRILGLVMGPLLAGSLALALGGVSSVAGGSGYPAYAGEVALITLIAIACALLLPALPSMSVWSPWAEKRQMVGSWFDLRAFFRAEPSSAIPYCLAYFVLVAAAAFAALGAVGGSVSDFFSARLAWAMSLLVLAVALGRLASGLSRQGPDAAARLHVGLLLLAGLMPVPLLLMLQGFIQAQGVVNTEALWAFYPLAGGWIPSPEFAIQCAVWTAFLAAVTLFAAERLRMKITSELPTTKP